MVTIRPGYWIALAVALTVFACAVVAGTVLGAVDRQQRQHNDRATRELAAVVWPVQLHP